MKGYVLHSMMILLGLMLIIAYTFIIKNIHDINCTAGRAASGVYTIGVIVLSIGVTLMLCGPSSDVSSASVTYLASALGVVLVVLGAILVNQTDSSSKGWSIVVLIVGLLLVVSCGVSIYSIHKDKLKKLVSSKYEYGCGMY
jgi:hypothetical protein